MAKLAELAVEAAACTRCALASTRNSVVFGAGDPHAALMIVGEAPGKDEDEQGEPFVGRSGKLLDQVLDQELGVTRDRVFIANTVKCLRYNAMVQLGDGSWERIGRLVRRQYDGDIKSVDENGKIVNRRVTGWHASPLAGRRVFRLTFRNAKRVGLGRVAVELTGDHLVLTEFGYMRAEDLASGIQVATGQGMSPLARDIVCGTLLGDGHIKEKCASLTIRHCPAQREYALFVAELLAEFETVVTDVRTYAVVGGPPLESVQMRTLASRSMWLLRDQFYSPKKTAPPWLSTGLTPRMLAFWFMDDGHMRIGPPRQPSAEIAAVAFAPHDLAILVEGLRQLGLRPTVRGGRIHFNVVEARKLSEIIAPFVPAVMRYKLHPEVEKRVPFDPSRFLDDTPEVMFDEAVITDVTDKPRGDVTFFCIDVEGTHNFVTNGGVVHNCRPPGNRDPQVEEIAACNPWLEAQLDAIAPKVVITLGNFATKVLLFGDPKAKEGITKLRGKSYPWRNGAVLVPTFHPSAVLRSGGGQPLAQMRADFIRAKRALGDAGVTL